MTLPAPGLHRGVPFAEYRAWPAVSASLLHSYARSPLHARHEQQHPRDSAALSLGRALHAAVLEPDLYAATYVPRYRAEGTGSRAINAAHAARVEAAGQVELSDDDREAVEGMRDAILFHSIARPLVTGALARELSVLWHDVETGTPCKARWDLALDGAVIGDLKTSRDARPHAFRRDCWDYGYAAAAAWYLAGAAALAPGIQRGWLWIVVESEAPHAVAVYEPDEELLALGAAETRRLLALHLECQRTGRFPGYAETVQTIRPPAWLAARSESA